MSGNAKDQSEGHIVITGPGRAGSTLLVRLLERLGLDTRSDSLDYDEDARAGLEYDIRRSDAPTVVKDPVLTLRLPKLLDRGAITRSQIKFVVIPLRDLESAAMSRLARSVHAGKFSPAGGLWGARTLRSQRRFLATATYGLLVALAGHEITPILIAYPRFARDCGYTQRCLEPIIGHVPEADFRDAWQRAVDPNLVRDDRALHVTRSRRIAWEIRARVDRVMGAARRRRARRRGRRDANA